MGAVRRSPDPRRGGLSRGGRRRGRAHALRARHGPRPPRVPPPLPLGPADRSGDPPQAVAAAAPQARALRGARLGGVRAADRVRPRSGDPAPDRAPPRAAKRLRDTARAAVGGLAGGALAGRARRVRPRPETVDRARPRGARGGLRADRPDAARAGLAATARHPEHRELDARDARRGRPGPGRPAAGARRCLPEAGRPCGPPRPPRQRGRGARVLRSLRRVRCSRRLLRPTSEVRLMTEKLEKTDAEWREELTPDRFHVLREKGTEPPFTGAYTHSKSDGMYRCGACGAELFSSDTKFDSGTGWPSFTEPAVADAVELDADNSLGMSRTEVTCARCGGHLGHVFPDGPGPGGQRFCINSLSLDIDENDSSS